MPTVQFYDYYKTLATPSQVVEGRATAATATATVPAPPVGEYAGGAVYIDMITLEGSAAPAAAVEATLTGLPGAVTLHFEIPAAAFAPIVYNYASHPLQCAQNTAAVLTLPSLGGTAVGVAKLFYHYGP